MKSGTIPYPREFTVGASGDDCRAVKRALSHAHSDDTLGMSLSTKAFGARAGEVLSEFKQKHGLLHDPIYTAQAHEKLQPFFSVQGAATMNAVYTHLAAVRERGAMVAGCHKFLSLSTSYAEVRPIPVSLPPFPRVTVRTDCSGSIVLIAKWVDLPDPARNNFNGAGNTGSFLALPHVTVAQAQYGDIIVYRDSIYDSYGHHAVLIVARVSPTDFDVFSFGQNPPTILRHSAMLASQAAYGHGVATVCRWLPAL